MSTVRIEILGRPYEVACDAGQEARLKALAGQVQSYLQSMVPAGAPASSLQHARLLLLLALSLMDENEELRRSNAGLQAELAEAQGRPRPDSNAAIKELLGILAGRLEPLAAERQ